MSALGADVSFASLVRADYVSTKDGSKLEDLIKAARSYGLQVKPVDRMTCAMLRQVDCPAILHYKRSIKSIGYDHWVLFMGTDSVGARLADGGKSILIVPYDELSARWDGVALLISNQPIRLTSVFAIAVIQYAAGVAAVLLGFALLSWLSQRLYWPRLFFWQRMTGEAACLLLFAVTVAIMLRLFPGTSLLGFGPAVASIEDSHFADFLPTIRAADVARMSTSTDVTIVDTRAPIDYDQAHIPGAINVAPTWNRRHIEEAIANAPKTNTLVLYAQSNGCDYAQLIAKRLNILGYQKLLLFRDGWIGWLKHHASQG
jgi:rhodanese-related sulfurtransferase